jgi:5'-nucleotidase
VASLAFSDQVAAVNRVAAQLKDQDLADVVVAEYHDGAPAGADSSTLAQEVAKSATFAQIVQSTAADVDVIFTGHTHQAYSWVGAVPGVPGATRPVIQTGSYGTNVGRVVLTLDAATKQVTSAYGSLVPVASTTETDAQLAAVYPRVAAVKTIVDAALANAQVVGATEVGKVSADITTAFSGGSYVGGVYTGGSRDDRAEASTMGTLVSNALRDTLKDLSTPPDFGVVNPGGLRDELYYGLDGGIVTFEEAKLVLPFDNSVVTVTLTGEQVVTMLEQQWQRDQAGHLPSRPYLQLGLSDDVRYTFTEADATCTGATPPNTPVPCKKGTVTGVTIDGVPIEPDAEYTVATFNFLAAGGDNFWVMAEGDMVDTGMMDWEGFRDYLTAASPLSPDFARAGVVVEDLSPDAATAGLRALGTGASALTAKAAVGSTDTLELRVSRMDLHSLGAPANTTLKAYWNDSTEVIGEATVTDGAAEIDAAIPTDVLGPGVLTLVAEPSGTSISVGVVVVAQEGEEPEPQDPGDNGDDKAGGKLPVTGSSDIVALVGAALALVAVGAVLTTRRRKGIAG